MGKHDNWQGFVMSYFGNYSMLLTKMVHEYELKNSAEKINEIDLSNEIIENPLESLLNTSQLWNDGYGLVKLNEFYALSLVGSQGSGKTSIAKQLATFAKENDFRIIYAMPDDYMPDVNSWLNMATVESRAKTFIILDDLSYFSDAQARKQSALVKNMVARVRHIFKGQIFMIFITHRLHATPPMMRNSASWIFTNMQSADRDDALEVIGRDKEQRERLERVYSFLSRASLEGANENRMVKINYHDKEYNFKWGDKHNAGDGRIMAIYHGGKMKLFHSKDIETSINFDDYRFIPVIPSVK